MPYTTTSGTDRKDLLTALESFASTNGWTTVYNDIVATGEVGIEKGNCHVAFGDAGTTGHTDMIYGGTQYDGTIYGALSTSLTASNLHYYGHPGSIVTTSYDEDRVVINDLYGSFSNIYLFTDSATSSTYIHCVVQSAADRYTFFSIGNLDKKGMTHADIGYLTGLEFTWWNNVADYTYNSSYKPNIPASHSYGFLGYAESQFYVPSGTLDVAYGYASGDLIQVGSASSVYDDLYDIFALQASQYPPTDAVYNATGKMFAHFTILGNDATTGGAPLWGIPWFIQEQSAYARTYVGDLPDVRLVNMTGFAAGDVVTYGSDEWQLFPWKTLGDVDETGYGGNPQPGANTAWYGLAIKRIT